jgi:hypothetical protein
MPIEFACTQCGKQLRTPDETAGRQAKCPQCGAIMQIPHLASAAPIEPRPIEPPPGEAAGAGGRDWNPFASPAIGGEAASRHGMSTAGEIVPTRADLSRVFGETQAIFGRNLGLCLLLGFSMLVIYVAFVFLIQVFAVATGIEWLMGAPGQRLAAGVGAAIVWVVVLLVVTWAFSSWLYMGIFRCFLRLGRGQPAGVGDLVSGAPYTVRAMAIYLIFLLINIAGLVLAILATQAAGGNLTVYNSIVISMIIGQLIIYLGVSQSFFLVVDRDLRAMDAIRTSLAVMAGNKFTLFLVLLGLFALADIAVLLMAFVSNILTVILGRRFGAVIVLLGFCVAALAATSYVFLLFSVFYLHVTGQPTAISDGAVY